MEVEKASKDIDLIDMINEIQRENKMRESFYKKQVEAGKMDRIKARNQLKTSKKIERLLEFINKKIIKFINKFFIQE